MIVYLIVIVVAILGSSFLFQHMINKRGFNFHVSSSEAGISIKCRINLFKKSIRIRGPINISYADGEQSKIKGNILLNLQKSLSDYSKDELGLIVNQAIISVQYYSDLGIAPELLTLKVMSADNSEEVELHYDNPDKPRPIIRSRGRFGLMRSRVITPSIQETCPPKPVSYDDVLDFYLKFNKIKGIKWGEKDFFARLKKQEKENNGS